MCMCWLLLILIQYSLQFVTKLGEVTSDDFTSTIIHVKAIENNKD